MYLARSTDGTLTSYQSQGLRSLYDVGSGGYGLAFQTGGTVATLTGSLSGMTTKMFVGLNGNVGIGTTTPATALDVNGAITARSRIDMYLAGDTTRRGLFGAQGDIGGADLSSTDIVLKSVGAFGIKTNNNDTSRLAVTTAGNVGIGTTTPATALVVNGTTTIVTGGGGGLRFSGDSAGVQQTTAYLGGSQTVTPQNVTPGGSFGYPGTIYPYSFPGSLAIGTSTTAGLPTNGLFVLGNVGIGTASPGAKLEVNGQAIVDASACSWCEGISVDSANGIWGGIKFRTTGRVGNNGNWHIGYDVTHSGASGSGNNLYVYTSGTGGYVMSYLESGNVGIGTTNPTSTLQIAGTFRASTGGGDVSIDSSGNFIIQL